MIKNVKPVIVEYAYNPSTWLREVGHPQLHSDFEVNLGYTTV